MEICIHNKIIKELKCKNENIEFALCINFYVFYLVDIYSLFTLRSKN